MPIKVGPSPKAATVSYTPLNLDTTLELMRKKVGEVESAAAAGYDAIGKLDIKEGYSTQGLADELNAKYKAKLQQGIDNLLKTGDTREFAKYVSSVQSELVEDPIVKVGLEDFSRKAKIDEEIRTNRGGYFGYLQGGAPPAKEGEKLIFNQIDWRNPEALNSATVQDHYGRFAKAENIYDDYTTAFRTNLYNLEWSEVLGIDPTTNEIEYATYSNKPFFTTVASKLKNSQDPRAEGIYEQLATDFEQGSTDSAHYYKTAGYTQDEFIGKVLLESAPYIGAEARERKKLETEEEGGGGGDKPELQPGAERKALPLATEVVGWNAMNDDDQNLVISIATKGFEDDRPELISFVQNALISLNNGQQLTEEQSKTLNALSFGASLLSQYDKEGYEGTAYSEVIKYDGRKLTGEELEALAENKLTELVSPYISTYIGDQAFNLSNSTGGDYIMRLANTLNMYGYDDVEDLKDAIESGEFMTRSSSDNKDELLLVGGSFLNQKELDSLRVFLFYGNAQYTETLMDNLQTSLDILNQQEEEITKMQNPTETTGITKTTFKEFSDVEHQFHIKNNPIAYKRFLDQELLRNADLIFSDLYITPNETEKASFQEALLQDITTNFSIDSKRFFEAFDVKEILRSDEGGYDFGEFASPRVVNDFEMKSYLGEKLDSDDTAAFVKDLTKWSKDPTKADGNTFLFSGAVLPGGQKSETGFLINKIDKDGNSKQYVIIPKTSKDLTSTSMYGAVKQIRETLAGKTYDPIVTDGYGYNGFRGVEMAEAMADEAALYNVNFNYGVYNDVQSKLGNNDRFTIAEDNPYKDRFGITPHFAGNSEIFRVRSKDGYEATWQDYFEGINAGDIGEQYILGSDLDDLLISLLIEGKLQGDGAKKASEIIVGTDLKTGNKLAEELGISLEDILKTKVSFTNHVDAVKHFTQFGPNRGVKKP